MAPGHADPDAILSAVSSFTASSATVAALQHLLGFATQPSNTSRTVKSTTTSRTATATTKAPARSRTTTKPSRTDAPVAIHTEDAPALSPSRRLAFATKLVNAGLRAVSDAAKQSSAVRATADATRPPRPLSHGQTRPLLERCPNSPGKRVVNAKGASGRSAAVNSSSNAAIVAECARLALAYVRANHCQSGSGLLDVALENGSLAFIGKCSALGLDSIVLKELKALKARLDQALGSKSPKVKTVTNGQDSVQSLLHQTYGGHIDEATFTVAIKFQIHLAKYILRRLVPAEIDEVLEAFSPQRDGSPIKAIEDRACSAPDFSQGAQQLESFVNTLLSACPSLGTAADSDARDGRRYPAPGAVLQIYVQVWRIRSTIAGMKQETIDAEQGVWVPMSRCFAAFSRRTPKPTSDDYQLAKGAYEQLIDLMENDTCGVKRSRVQSSALPQITLQLSSLAQAAGRLDDAWYWAATSQERSPQETEGSARSAIILLRLASLSLQVKHGTNIVTYLEQAHAGLSSISRSDGNDLDVLLLEVAGYRKVLMVHILSESESSDSFAILRLCHSGIIACMRFLVRYLGRIEEQVPGTKPSIRQQERYEKASKAAPGLTDSVLHCCRCIVRDHAVDWQEVDKALDHCLHVASILGSQNPDDKYTRGNIAVRASSLYLAIYRQNGSSDRSSIGLKALKRSVAVLAVENCSIREKGMYTQKLEQLSHAHQTLLDFAAAFSCYEQAIQHYDDLDYLRQLTVMAANKGYDYVWSSETGLIVSKTLDSIDACMHRAVRQAPRLFKFYDVDHPQEVRALLLERQLNQCCAALLGPGGLHSHAQIECVEGTLATLFTIYTQAEYPIRRLRLISLYIKLKAGLSPHLDHVFAGVAKPDAIDNKVIVASKDAALSMYLQHWQFSNDISWELLDGDVSDSTLTNALSFWSLACNRSDHDTTTVDQSSGLLGLLQVVCSLLNIKRKVHTRAHVLFLIETLLISRPIAQQNPDAVANAISNTSLHLLDAGLVELCGPQLSKLKHLMNTSAVSESTLVAAHFLEARYHLALDTYAACQESLNAAGHILKNDLDAVRKGQMRKADTLHTTLQLAQALDLSARLKIRQGSPASALADAKQHVKLLQRSWAALENDKLQESGSGDEGTVDTQDNTANGQLAPVSRSLTHEALTGPRFWQLVPRLVQGYQHVSFIYRHHGMFAESLYWIDGAQKICDAVSCSSLSAVNAGLLAELYYEDDQQELGDSYFQKLNVVLPAMGTTLDQVECQKILSRIHCHKADYKNESVSCENGQQSLKNYINSWSQIETLMTEDSTTDLVNGISKLRIDEEKNSSSVVRSARTASKAPSSTKSKQPTRKQVAKRMERQSNCARYAILTAMEEEMTFNRITVLWRTRAFHAAAQLLSSFEAIDSSKLDGKRRLHKQLLSARLDLATLLDSIMSERNLAMLPESTICIPSLETYDEVKPSATIIKASKPASTTKRTAKPATSRKPTKSTLSSTLQSSVSEAGVKLCETRNSLESLQSFALRVASVAEYGQICRLLAVVAAYVSAATQASGQAHVRPSSAAMAIERPSIFAGLLASAASKAGDRMLSREEMYEWPSVALSHDTSLEYLGTMSPNQFQELYVDILPAPWTVISLHLSDSKEDLFVARYRQGESPFVLRVPITAASHGSLDDGLSYDEGKAELLEIIADSYDSTHNSKYIESREAKLEWWATREALDTRIHELLLNIEKIWFGGFRGILGSPIKQAEPLAKLQKAIVATLQRHLPSRRSKKKHKAIRLDARVWEMFAGLGDPRDETVDIDEGLVDLFYFVVDILQFEGETNAYDEIDFDGMVLDALDALKIYHASTSVEGPAPDEHTVLILDQDLHMFPWESIPSLAGRNVSRLSSLEDLRTRIMAMKVSQRPSPEEAGHYITSSAGRSLLNPSGDLAGTETVIQPLLASLPGSWTHSTMEPSDKQLSHTLSSVPLFLYFGHGSGNQFISSKTVRALPRCPTTWLMGCSSAALATHGGAAFQPSGMVLAYLAAGAPAVVGTLWDVTDKDCDRASVAMGAAWGLWRAEGAVHKLLALKGRQVGGAETERARGARGTGLRRKKGEVVERVESRGDGVVSSAPRSKTSLVEAVRLGREECYLRYLNGAALVVYGIPVYLYD